MTTAVYHALWFVVFPLLRLAAAWDIVPAWDLARRIAVIPGLRGPLLWFHCASLGEAKGMAEAVRVLRKPGMGVLCTAATRAGLEFLERPSVRQPAGAAWTAHPAPPDHRWFLEGLLARLDVRGVCLYECELWPGLLAACSRRGVPVALVSARAAGASRRLAAVAKKQFKSWLGPVAVAHLRDPEQERLFARLLPGRTLAGADCKALYFLRRRTAPAPRTRDTFAFASLHLAELRALLPVLETLSGRWKLAVFPRRPREVPRFRRLLAPLGFGGRTSRHFLSEVFGEMEAVLPGCAGCFVGGSLIPRGCHNLWEPLAAGCRIYLGPWDFHQVWLARELLERGWAVRIRTPGELVPARPTPPNSREVWDFLRAYRQQALESLRELGARWPIPALPARPGRRSEPDKAVAVPRAGGNRRL